MMRTAFRSLEDRAIEWYSALVMLGWGVTFALPGDTLAAPQFESFSRFGTSEEFWAFAFSTVGAARLVALYINGRWPRTPTVRMIGSLFGAVSWAQVSIMLLETSISKTGILTTGPIVYGLLALFDVFSIYRAAFDARYHRPR